MKFLIQEGVFDGDEQQLINVLKQKKIPYIIHPPDKIDPYLLIEHGVYNKDKIFCCGSLELIKHIQKTDYYKCFKTICDFPNFDCRIYYHYFKNYLFNQEGSFLTYSELEKIPSNPIGFFVRPAGGHKPKGFSGQVIKEFNKDLFHKNESYLMACPKHIDFEWRAVVANKKFITGCQYKTFCKETKKLGFDPDTSCPQKVIDYVNEVVKRVSWEPNSIYVMDIVESNDRLYVMELNGLSTSGWYDCDCGKIVDSILEYYNES